MSLTFNQRVDQFVLVLDREQAETLGTLRFLHVAGSSPLYDILAGLPVKDGHEFVVNQNGEELTGMPRPVMLGLHPMRERRTATQGMPRPGWIVQYHQLSNKSWERVMRASALGATEVYTSRNEAYRQLRRRAESMLANSAEYRVVPANTPDGPELDRGYYTAQYWSRSYSRWEECHDGPGFYGRRTFPSVEIAQATIDKFGSIGDVYRVKWHPGTPGSTAAPSNEGVALEPRPTGGHIA
ncbi:hypothetical protein S3_00004 [Xanthomonas phage S3]|nr:hypothetical protein GF2_00004 [Xanthomonas phage GF2]WAX24123.1 hypothetical protein GF1_00010 [Xanthomonas phage GF1]WAX24209.1 hypothetical protein S3_00004 [Xanthomonas phage S3]